MKKPKNNIWKFVLIFFILIASSFLIWRIYDRGKNYGPYRVSNLKNLDEEYFTKRLGKSFVFFAIGDNGIDLQSDEAIKTILSVLYLKEDPVSISDFKKYMKENFGLDNYDLETGEYQMINGMKYTVTKTDTNYTAFLPGFGYEGLSYKYLSYRVDGAEVIVSYDKLVAIDLPKNEYVITGKYDVYFKLKDGYLIYDRITYQSYDIPEK